MHIMDNTDECFSLKGESNKGKWELFVQGRNIYRHICIMELSDPYTSTYQIHTVYRLYSSYSALGRAYWILNRIFFWGGGGLFVSGCALMINEKRINVLRVNRLLFKKHVLLNQNNCLYAFVYNRLLKVTIANFYNFFVTFKLIIAIFKTFWLMCCTLIFVRLISRYASVSLHNYSFYLEKCI